MMMSEFIERTGYEPSYEEYHYIEESYYEFPGNKDEFCKQWKKDQKDGHWQRELKLMKAMDEMKAQYEKKIADQEENLNFYRPYFDRATQAEKKATILDLISEESVNVEIKINGRWEKHENAKVNYIAKSYNGIFEFINIVDSGNWRGWATSYKLDDIEAIKKF